MRAVTIGPAVTVEVADVPEPTLIEPGDAIVKVRLAGICGTDIRTWATREPGIRPGHEFIGDVVAIGPDVTTVNVGDHVLGSPLVGCGRCPSCRCKDPYRCRLGFRIFGENPSLQGAQGEYVRVPAADLTLRSQGGLSDASALLLTDALPTGWAAAALAQVRPGTTVLVIGLGPVGLCAVRSCQFLGADKILGVESDQRRRPVAAALGVDALAPSGSTVDEVLDRTSGSGVDVTIEAIGNESTLTLALGCTGRLGTIVAAGLIDTPMVSLPLRRLGAKSLTLRGLVCASSAVWPELVPLVEAATLLVDDLLTHKFDLDDAPTAYEAARDHRDGELKIGLHP